MFSRAKPAPWGPKLGPGLSATLPCSRIASGGVFAEVERAQIEPGKVAGLRLRAADLGQMLSQELRQQAAVVVEHCDHVVEPWSAVAEGGDGGDRAQMAAVGGAERQPPDHLGRALGGGDDLGAVQAGDVERLRRRAKCDSSLRRGLGDGEERHMPRAGKGQRRVDLVREHPGAVARRRVGDRGQLLPARNAAGGVVGAAEDQRDGALGEAPLDRFGIELAGGKRRLGQLASELLDHGEEGVVDGRVDDDALTRFRDRSQHRRDRADHIGAGRDPPRIQAPLHPVLGKAGEGLGQPQLLRRGVAAVVKLHRLGQRKLDRLGQREVHLGNPGGQHIGWIARPLGAVAEPQAVDRDLGQRGIEGRRHRPELFHAPSPHSNDASRR